MRRLFRWVIGLLSALALWRAWSRRRKPEPHVEPEPDPAEELRLKLAAARTDDEPAADEQDPGPDEESLDDRRARVHAKAQEAIEAMREDES